MKPLRVVAVLLCVSVIPGADWPQWRGPDRTAISKETGLLQEWAAGGPARVWTSTKLGRGFGGPAVVGDRIYALGGLGEKDVVEHVIALDGVGERLWSAPIAPAYDFRGNSWSLGPNSTPSVDGRFIFALGSQGVVVCVDDAGAERWRVDLVKDLGGRVNPVTGEGLGWGYSWSPVIAGDLVIIAPGGTAGVLAALDKATGKVVWRSKDAADDCTYSSPVVATLGGVPQVIYAAQTKVYGVDLKDGRVLWVHEKKRQAEEIVAPTPLVRGDAVFVSASAAGAELFRVAAKGSISTTPVWDSKAFANLHGGVVLVGDHLYGSHETRAWKCLTFATGADAWESRRPGPGSLAYADERLYCVSQDGGTVSLLEATPKAFSLKGQFTLPAESKLRKPNGRLWTHPVIANGRLFVRDQELLFCFSVRR
jgi:outer membrane protein assembly factor BamB